MLTSVRYKIDAHRDEDVCTQIETAENLHLADAIKLIVDYERIVNELGVAVLTLYPYHRGKGCSWRRYSSSRVLVSATESLPARGCR